MAMVFQSRGRWLAAAGAVTYFLVAALVGAPGALAGQQVSPSQGRPIVGGTEAHTDAYPFMAALLHKGESASVTERHFCGGTLVHPLLVMTAAHCAERVSQSDMEIVVGRTNLNDVSQGAVYRVGKGGILFHPGWPKDRNYDAALIYLDRPVEGITPISLPTPRTDALLYPGSLATVMGWGYTASGYHPDRLRQVDVPLLSPPECKIAYGDYYDEESSICAGVSGKNFCAGDSGGPLFKTVPGRQDHIQIGIVSRGIMCAVRGGPGIYASLSSASFWDKWQNSSEGKEKGLRLESSPASAGSRISLEGESR